MAFVVRKGKRFSIRLTTDPPDSKIDLKDVPVTVTSSDPATVEAILDPNDPTLIKVRTLVGGTAGPASVLFEPDVDQDFGEVRLLEGRFDMEVTDSVVEPTSIGAVVEGPVVDDVENGT